MNNFKLEPVDIGVNLIRGNAPYPRVKRWVLGPFSHVWMYLGKASLLVSGRQRRIIRIPLIFESIGRGVMLRSLSERYGEEVVIMRLISEHDRRRIARVLEEAVKLASDPQSHYDYFCILQYILPRLICEKLGLPVPLSWQRNPWHVCSEAVYEVCYRGGLVDILPGRIVPLPGDFVTDSILLEEVQRGILSDEWV